MPDLGTKMHSFRLPYDVYESLGSCQQYLDRVRPTDAPHTITDALAFLVRRGARELARQLRRERGGNG